MASNLTTPTLTGTQGGTITLTLYTDNELFQEPADGNTSVYTVIDTAGGTNIGSPQSVMTTMAPPLPSIQLDVTNLNLAAGTDYQFFYDSGSMELTDYLGDPFGSILLDVINNISSGGGGGGGGGIGSGVASGRIIGG